MIPSWSATITRIFNYTSWAISAILTPAGSHWCDPAPTAFMEEAVMAQFDLKKQALVGAGGLLSVREDDEITRKLSMLVEGECEGLGPIQAAEEFGYSKQRYFQLRAAFAEGGAQALQSQKRGPKT